jgi:hypothetical protein
MTNDLPISPNKRFKYSITFESWDEDSLEMGQTDVRGYIEQDETDTIGDILYEAGTTYGIYMPFAFGRWESTYPDEDAEYFEKGIRKFYFLEITNEDGTQITDEESDFITFLLSDGRYELDKFRDYAVGGIVLGSIALGVGALITYFYFKDKKASSNKVEESSLNSRAKSVTHNINGVDKKFPIKDAWRKEHKIENKQQKFEVPQGDREPLTYADGGDISSYYDDVEFGTGGIAKTKEIITKKIGLSEQNADFLISKSEKYAIWLADSIIKAQLNINKEITKEQAVKFVNNDTNILKGLSQRITGILDWLKSPNLPQQNLRELTFAEAERKSKIWHDELSVSGGDIDFTEPKENIVLKAYPKNEFGKTYYWVLLPSNTCRLESSRMGHCGQSGKSDNLISFRSDYVNSKGENINDSHITIGYGDGLFYQSKGKQNKKPLEKYFPYVFDFIKSLVKGEIEDLTFNGFASEYQGKEDYGWEDMTKQELTELYELNPNLFTDFAGEFMLYEAGIINERPNTTIVIEKSPESVGDLLKLDRDLSDEVVEKVLTGDTFDWYDNSWSYYYENAGDYVDNLNEGNYEQVINKIVELTELDKSVVKENGAKHYLAGDDEEFDSDTFDDINRALASALSSAEESAYVKYYYEQIESALSELGTIKKLNYEGLEIEIDLLDKMSIGGISSYMKDLETEYLEDVFFEAESQGDIEFPELSIDSRYSAYPEDEDFNANFDIDNYSKGGSLRPKNISINKKTKIKNMKPNQKKYSKGGEIKSFILGHNQLSSRENMHIGFNKGDLMKMAYGETYRNVDSALPLGLLDEMGIGKENSWHYVMDYNGNSFGEVTDLFEKITLKNPNVEVFNTDYESIEILPILEASEKYANQEVLFQLAKNSDKYADGGDLGVSKEDYFIVVKNWVYFTFNYPMGFVKDVFNSEHLQSKFSSSYDRYGSMGVLPSFWSNLDGNNREILALWIKNNYVNESADKNKLQSISDDDYVAIINHWNMFCFNFPYGFIQKVFLGNTSHYEQKWSRANDRAGSTIGAVNIFFTELDGGNQRLLTDFASDIKKFADGGEAGEKSTKNIRKKRPKTRQPKMVRQYFEDEAYAYADGGMIEHGLRVGDEILEDSQDNDEILVLNNKENEVRIVNLDKGERFANGGRVTSRSGIIEVFLTSNRQLTVGNLSTHYNEYDNQMLLRNYGTLIATRKGNDVEITNVKYSQTTSRITNEVNSTANQKGMNVSYVSKFADGGETGENDAIEKLWNGYASAILFAEMDSDTEEPLDENYSISDFDEETVTSSKNLIRKFYVENKNAIEKSGIDLDTIGNDIWYTRAGHGAGFFDHNLDEEIENKLTKGAKALGEYPSVETYDGKISVRGGRVFDEYAGGGKAEKKYYWIKMDREKIDEYIKYASRMVGMFEGEIYTQAPNKVAFDTEDDMFAFTSMIENHNDDNDFQEGDEGYIYYEELYNGEPRPNFFDKIISDNYAKGGKAGEKSTKNTGTKKLPKNRQPRMVRQYFEDSPYSYAEGGETYSFSDFPIYANEDGEVRFVRNPKKDVGKGEDKEYAISVMIDGKVDKYADEYFFDTEKKANLWVGKLNKFQEQTMTNENKQLVKDWFAENDDRISELIYNELRDLESQDFKYYVKNQGNKKFAEGGEADNDNNDEGGEVNLLSDKFTEVGYKTYARNFGVASFDDEKNINILVSANLIDMYDATGEEEFEDKPFVFYIETHAYPKFWSDEYAENIKDMVGDDTINPKSIDYLSDAHSYGLGVPLSTYADGMRFKTEEEAIEFLNSKKLNDQISGLGMLSGFHFDKQINRIGDTGWKYLSEQVGANYEEYAEGGEIQDWMEQALSSLIEETGNETLDITMVSNSGNEFFAGNDNEEYRVFKSEDDAELTAEDEVREMLEDSPENFNQDFIINYIDGGNFFEDYLDEMNRSYAEDIASESDSKYANRLIAEMVDNGLLDEDDAESDNADELAEERIEDFVNLLTEEQMNQGNKGFDYFVSNFGQEETMQMVINNNLIDIYQASKEAVAEDGIGHFLSSYDGETLYLSDGYVAYRNN